MQATITKTEYKELCRRQEKLEKQVFSLRGLLTMKTINEEPEIRPEKLKQLAKTSANMKKGGGHRFDSIEDMERWLKNI